MKDSPKSRRFEVSLVVSLVLLAATAFGALVNATLNAQVVL